MTLQDAPFSYWQSGVATGDRERQELCTFSKDAYVL